MAAPARVRAPQLVAGDWINSAPLSLAGLRGRFVLLDFWTSCCGNCLHVLDELRPIEARLADVLTVVGVHSPKFSHEAEPAAVAAAIARNDIDHPVLNDPGLRLWQQYAVRAWPTLVLVDPEGYVIAQAAGEGQAEALAAIVDQRRDDYAARGTLTPGAGPAVETSDARTGGTRDTGTGTGTTEADAVARTVVTEPPLGAPLVPLAGTLTGSARSLRFPARAIVLPADRTGRDSATLLVADAGHHQLVELEADATTELRRIGSGARTAAARTPETPSTDTEIPSGGFAEPNGLALLPSDLADALGWDVAVADTANHVLRGVSLRDGRIVTTLDLPAALAEARTVTGAIPAVLSPWDVVWWPALDRLVVAAAGVHLLLAVDPRSGATQVLAGTTVEGLRDGPALDGWLAQPSGLAVDGDTLWFVDAETSALRRLTVDSTLHTDIGEGLFDFGHVDGPAATARLQHPLGLAVLPDGAIALADTYNGAIRRLDPATGEVTTLMQGLAEPADVLLVDGTLLVVESAAHRLVPLERHDEHVGGDALRTARPVSALAAGPVQLRVPFTPPAGRHLDERYGPATRLSVSASPAGLLLAGAGDSVELDRELVLADGVEGVLQVVAQAASCDDDGSEHPACYLARQDWGVPVRVGDGGAATLELPLLG